MTRGFLADDEPRKSDLVDVKGYLLSTSPSGKAYKFFTEQTPKAGIWLPTSLCEWSREKGDKGTMTMPKWLAVEKGLV